MRKCQIRANPNCDWNSKIYFFHSWTTIITDKKSLIYAIIEDEDGLCTMISIVNIKFIDGCKEGSKCQEEKI